MSKWVPNPGPRFWAHLPLPDASPECERALFSVDIRGMPTLDLADRTGLKNGGEWGAGDGKG